MAFRGGRGRGRGGRGGRGGPNRFPKHEPFLLFPEQPNMPIDPVYPPPTDEKETISWKVKLENFLKGSCYHLQDSAPKSRKQDAEIGRCADRDKSKLLGKRESLASYLKLTISNFPSDLIQGSKRVQPASKKLKWGRDSDKKMIDMFEKLDEKDKGDEKAGKEKKGESEDEEEPEEEEEEESSDDDYNQNIDFDDDEDDLNMAEEEHEDYYD